MHQEEVLLQPSAPSKVFLQHLSCMLTLWASHPLCLGKLFYLLFSAITNRLSQKDGSFSLCTIRKKNFTMFYTSVEKSPTFMCYELQLIF